MKIDSVKSREVCATRLLFAAATAMGLLCARPAAAAPGALSSPGADARGAQQQLDAAKFLKTAKTCSKASFDPRGRLDQAAPCTVATAGGMAHTYVPYLDPKTGKLSMRLAMGEADAKRAAAKFLSARKAYSAERLKPGKVKKTSASGLAGKVGGKKPATDVPAVRGHSGHAKSAAEKPARQAARLRPVSKGDKRLKGAYASRPATKPPSPRSRRAAPQAQQTPEPFRSIGNFLEALFSPLRAIFGG